MIIKERKIPLKILKLRALLRRLPENHRKRREIEEELEKSVAGYNGEQSLDYDLSFLPEKDYHIIHDLRLKGETYYFQMDTIILTPFFILIIEVKHISGLLCFDPLFNQLIRKKNEVEEVFPDPVIQVKHQQFQLQKWFTNKKCPPIPIESIVVITNPASQIKILSNDRNYINKIIRNTNLIEKIASFKAFYKKEKWKKREFQKISKLLITNHHPNSLDVLHNFQIPKTSLITGVHCSNCGFIPMDRNKGSWHCKNCSNVSKEAHIESLTDYLLLFQSTITNQKTREFLNLSSSSIAQKLLFSMGLEYSGTTKSRVYHLKITGKANHK